MRLLSWNIQSGKGCDDHTDIHRIINHISCSGEYDVICLQEVARNMEEYCAKGQMDQPEIIGNVFSTYSFVWGTGFSWPNIDVNKGNNQEFGNLTLIKKQLSDHRVHPLPMPATNGNKQMPRVAVETIVNREFGQISIINTHLAYHDSSERQQQLERLKLLEQERKNQILYPKKHDAGVYQVGSRPVARILCGDFNFGIDFPEYEYQIENQWLDAWTVSNKNMAHTPTCGLFDHKQWPQGPHCRDYFWLSNELATVKMNMDVDTVTPLSDHQPIVLEINI